MKHALFALALIAAIAASPAAVAQSYPTKPVKIIVPSHRAPLGTSRARARRAPRRNVGPGGSSESGRARATSAPRRRQAAPDGYTLVMLGINTVINPTSTGRAVRHPADFKPIVRVGIAPLGSSRTRSRAKLDSRIGRAAKARRISCCMIMRAGAAASPPFVRAPQGQPCIEMTHVPYQSTRRC